MLKISAILLCTLLALGNGQDCAPRWVPFNGKCWYFSDQTDGHAVGMTWSEAESYCQQQDSHLASFETIEERDWAYNSYLVNWPQTHWWIGLTDVKTEQTFQWTDGTPYDPAVENWKVNEPSNSGKEDCVEVWVDPPLYRGQWNDNQCDKVDPFICKGETGSFQSSCPVGWTKIGEQCYKITTTEAQWHYASLECEAQGAHLVSIVSDDEQAAIESLISPQNADFWLGLSDERTPGVLHWSNPGAVDSSYDNWAPSQPPNPLDYQGSTCTVLSVGNSYQWVTGKCSMERKYVCQRGLNGRCPYGWLLLGEKCYEFVLNENRIGTWSYANAFCQAQGAKMLKIETEEQHTGVGNILQQYQDLGFNEIWLGGSDVGHDEIFKWSDGTTIKLTYWGDGQPRSTVGREDCMSIYTGNTEKNWEASSCFYEQPFICELPVGSTLPSIPIVTVHKNRPKSAPLLQSLMQQLIDGRCDEGWRHFKDNCYWFSEKDDTQSGANSACTGNQAQLVSVLDEFELSFVVGHIQDPSWIGLQYSQNSYQWKDGSDFSFNNWGSNFPTNQPCVFTQENGEWNDGACGDYHNYVCKKAEYPSPAVTYPPPTGNPADIEKCGPDGWFSDPSTTQCYFINIFQIRSWDDARHDCQQMGGDLIAINSPQEQEFIHIVTVNQPTAANYWIGAIDTNRFQLDVADGGWRWSDGTPFNYLNWNSGEPNNSDDEDCAEMLASSGLWNDVKCDRFFHYICEKTGNTGASIGTDVEDSNCRSNEACCFKHLGVEYGGRYDDSVLSASTEKSQYYDASRGRLNSPANVIVISDDVAIGTGHGAWMPKGSDSDPWLQVDLPGHMEVKGIITQGRNGIVQYVERQWTKTFKISYSQDPENTGKDVTEWEWLSDQSGNPIIFDGNNDQNTQVTNLFPRPFIARHVRCHPVTWKDPDSKSAALRLEYIGCYSSCLFKLGMNSGLISDKMITASSSGPGLTPQDARAPVDKDECLASGSDKGANYRGWISKTTSGRTCQLWSSQSPHTHEETPQQYPDADLVSNFCRNPNNDQSPWCYTTDPDVEWEYCNVPICPTYSPKGWSPSTSNTNQYVQVQFSEFFKVSGVTLHTDSTSVYVSKYVLMFSDDGIYFKTYTSFTGQEKIFQGNDGTATEYTDILSEPVSAKYVRIQPRQWVGGKITLRFEVHGCYVDRRITCSDVGTDFDQESFTINCPTGCVEDVSSGPVYGTTVYTENSAVCPAAIHAGRITDQRGGSVDVLKTPGLAQYLGTFSNGIESQSATASHYSLEFDGSVFRCADGWKPYQDHCYLLSTKDVAKNWQDARAECLSMGADLVSIHTSGESDFVEYTIQGARIGRDVWIGMNDLITLNYFQWSDGSAVTFSRWDLNEPNGGSERCVHIYRLTGAWNDRSCSYETGYMCKKEKEKLPPLDEDEVVDEGCEAGWSAYGSSCYKASTDRFIFLYAERVCQENGASLASIHDDQENAFIHALVTSSLPPGLGYTSWLGMAARTGESGELYYSWESGEPVSYTHWMQGEPDVIRDCYFPFEYEGKLYYECINFDHPLRQDHPWCSVDPVFNNRWINCDTGYEASCAYMDDDTGFWGIDFCLDDRHYVCEKDRTGYTQPSYTTPPTTGTCADGWKGDTTTSHCYQINEFTADDIQNRLNWQDALSFCRDQGGDLASIHSIEEAEAITRFVTQAEVYSYTYFWIGLNILNLDAGYTWTDGSPTDYTNWAAGEPNDHQGLEKCVEGQFYDVTTGWNDLSCDSLRNYICKIPKGKDPLPPPTVPPPEGNENDPVCTPAAGETWISYQPSYGTVKCYMFNSDPGYGWQFAENDCVSRGGNLVSVHSDDENRFLVGRIALSSRGIYWIGLRDVGDRAFFWSDNSYVDYQKWASGEPNNYYDSEGCSTIHVDGGTWNDDNCGRIFGYVCQKLPGATGNTPAPTPQATGNCPQDFVPYGNNCYITGGDTKDTWENARQWCKDNGAELVSVTNSYEQAFINNYLFGTRERFWTGLSDRNTNNGQFVWIDESEVSYTNWAPGEPSGVSEGCAVIDMNNDGWWYDNPCTDTNGFLCYAPKSDSIGAPPVTQSPLGCPAGYYSSSHEPACYQLVDEPKSWQEARQYCKDQGDGIELVSIHEMYDNELLKSWFWHDITSGDSIWIGMQFTSPPEGEGATSFYWSDGWPVLFTNWGVDEPNNENVNTGGGCVMMNRDGFWVAVASSGGGSTCSSPMPFVCKKSFEEIPTTPAVSDQVCDTGFIPIGQYCYYFSFAVTDDGRKNWFDASRACEQRHATLASVHSDVEVEQLVSIMSVETTNALFIGLESDGFGGWRWADKSGVEYFNWNEGEPNGEETEECVEMYSDSGKWNDITCFDTKGFICKKVAGSTRCAVGLGRRIDCGSDLDGIGEDYCVTRRGCCWDETWKGGNNSGCFYDEEYTNVINPTEEPVGPNGKGGSSVGVIVGVIIAVLVVLAIVGGVVYCKCFSSSKSLPSLSMPSMPAVWSTSSGKSSKQPQEAGGFDNPMGLGDDGNFHAVA